jgi:hypothetical protein
MVEVVKMATCKDCVSYDLCKYRHFQEVQKIRTNQTIFISIDHNKPCKFFKNKADFVEVKHGRWETENKLLDIWRKHMIAVYKQGRSIK